MTTEPMTPDEQYDFYAQSANQEPQGQPRRRSRRLTAPMPTTDQSPRGFGAP